MPSYSLGRLRFSINGVDPIVPCLQAEFSQLPIAEPGSEGLRIEFGEAPVRRSGWTDDRTLPLICEDGVFTIRNRSNTYSVMQDGLALRVVASTNDQVHGSRLRALVDSDTPAWRWFSPQYRAAALFVDDVFAYISQVAQLRVGQSYLRSAGLERDGLGLVIIGNSQSGKTSTLLEMVLAHGWHYLSNDLLPVTSEGTGSRSHEWLHINGPNILGESRIRERVFDKDHRLLSAAAFRWRSWRYGPEQTWYRLSAEELFGAEGVSVEAPIRIAAYIERVDQSDFSTLPLSVERASHIAVHGLLRTLGPFTDLSIALHSNTRTAILPSLREFYDATVGIIAPILEGALRVGIRVPLRARPSEIAVYLDRLVSRYGDRFEVASGGN